MRLRFRALKAIQRADIDAIYIFILLPIFEPDIEFVAGHEINTKAIDEAV